MSSQNFSGIILQPHNTPLSQLLREHRDILKNLAPWLDGGKLYPVYPCHCLVKSELSAKELKKQITGCRILPPQLQDGFLFRPVEVAGVPLQALPPQLLHQILPFLSEQELENKSIPTGFIFGYVSLQQTESLIRQGLESLSARIESLNLRVFRLQHIEYRYLGSPCQGSPCQGNGTSEPLPSSLDWTMELPHWVKINPPRKDACHKEL